MKQRSKPVVYAMILTFLATATLSAATKYQPNWQSLRRHQIPQWLLDAKFGIYAHWGVYSVGIGPAWTEKHLYNPAFSEGKTDAQSLHKKFEKLVGGTLKDGKGYKDLIPFFKAEKYDPAAWADLVVKSRARFAGFSISHHDGFGLWDSDVYDFHAGKMGPKKDLYGMFVAELKKRNVKIITTEHMYRTFGWMNPPAEFLAQAKAENWDVLDPRYKDIYPTDLNGGDRGEFLKQWDLKMREVIDRYQPDLIWCDGGQFLADGIVVDTLAYYFNQAEKRGQHVGILNKRPMRAEAPFFNFPDDFEMYDYEHGRDRPVVVERPWIDSMTITGKGWNYTGYDGAITAGELLKNLIDDVARGGGVLLSLAPRADGTIPEAQQQTLIETGKWLDQNGEAIFETVQWKYPSDDTKEEEEEKYIYEYRPGFTRFNYEKMRPEDVRYTMAKDRSAIYVLTIGSPEGKTILAKRLGSAEPVDIKRVSLLGCKKKIDWQRTARGLAIMLPDPLPNDKALAFKVDLK